jgi:hypothetical protein
VEQALLLHVGLDERHPLRRPAGEAEVVDRHPVDGEDAAGGAVLGRHVGDRRAVGERQAGEARAVELDEFAHHALLPQHLGDAEHEVGRRRALGELAGQPEADHLRQEHRDRLAEHRRLGLDAADAPAQDPQAVDHRGVRVGADQGVRIGPGRPGAARRGAVVVVHHHHPRQVLEVHLVDDAGVRRHHLEVVERRLPPAQEGVALAVPLELALGVDQEGRLAAVLVDLDRVVDDQLDRLQGVDPRRVAAHRRHGVAHRREVDHGGDAGEVLEQHPRRHEGDLLRRRRRRVPRRDRRDLLGAHDGAVLAPQQVLEQDAHGVGQPPDVAARAVQGGQAGDPDLATAEAEGRVAMEGVGHRLSSRSRAGGAGRASESGADPRP